MYKFNILLFRDQLDCDNFGCCNRLDCLDFVQGLRSFYSQNAGNGHQKRKNGPQSGVFLKKLVYRFGVNECSIVLEIPRERAKTIRIRLVLTRIFPKTGKKISVSKTNRKRADEA